MIPGMFVRGNGRCYMMQYFPNILSSKPFDNEEKTPNRNQYYY